MASRSDKQKPDPALRRNVQRARADMHKSKNGTALVISTSLAATVGAWILLANPIVPEQTTIQANDTNQYTITTQADSTGTSDLSATTVLTLTPTTTPSAQIGSAFDSSSSQSTVDSIQQPVALVVTRSSR